MEALAQEKLVKPLDDAANKACGTGYLPERQSVLADGSAPVGRLGPTVAVQADRVDVEERRDDKEEGQDASAIVNFSQLFRIHDVTSLDKSIATTIHASPYMNDRRILNARSENDAPGMAAGVMSINPNHPAPKFANTSDSTLRVAGSLPFIIPDSITSLPPLSTNFSYIPPAFAQGFGLARQVYAADGNGPSGGPSGRCAAALMAVKAARAAADFIKNTSWQMPHRVIVGGSAVYLQDKLFGDQGGLGGGGGGHEQVTVYTVIPKQMAHAIRQTGLQRAFNQMLAKSPILERIFEEERLKRKIIISRTDSLYAYPQHPSEIRYGLSFDPETDEILEVTINPIGVLVANGEYYTEAGVALERGDAESARDWAATYWETAIPLDQYQEGEFTFPEVLIPYDIPPVDISGSQEIADGLGGGGEGAVVVQPAFVKAPQKAPGIVERVRKGLKELGKKLQGLFPPISAPQQELVPVPVRNKLQTDGSVQARITAAARELSNCLSDTGLVSRVYAAGGDGQTSSCFWFLRAPWRVIGSVLPGHKVAIGSPPPIDEYEKELQKRYQRIALLAFLAGILRSSDPCSPVASYYDQLKESLYESALGFYKASLSNVYAFDTVVNNNPSLSASIKRSLGYFGSVGQCKTVGECVEGIWGAAKKSTVDLSAGAGLSALIPSNKPKKELPGNPNYKPYLEIIKKATNEYKVKDSNIKIKSTQERFDMLAAIHKTNTMPLSEETDECQRFTTCTTDDYDKKTTRLEIIQREVKDIISKNEWDRLNKLDRYLYGVYPYYVVNNASDDRSVYDVVVGSSISKYTKKMLDMYDAYGFQFSMSNEDKLNVLDLDTYIDQQYKLTGKPVENSNILAHALEISDGDIDEAIDLVGNYYKAKTRLGIFRAGGKVYYNKKSPADINASPELAESINEFKTKVLDEFSTDIPWNVLTEAQPPFAYEGVAQSLFLSNETKTYIGKDFDLSYFNRVGGAYHALNLISLSRMFPPEFISIANVDLQRKDNNFIGIGKSISDVTIMEDLFEINAYLDAFNPMTVHPWPPVCQGKQ